MTELETTDAARRKLRAEAEKDFLADRAGTFVASWLVRDLIDDIDTLIAERDAAVRERDQLRGDIAATIAHANAVSDLRQAAVAERDAALAASEADRTALSRALDRERRATTPESGHERNPSRSESGCTKPPVVRCDAASI